MIPSFGIDVFLQQVVYLGKTYLTVVLTIVTMGVLRFCNEPDKPPILGLYQQRNKYYWLKFVFMYLVLNLRQFTDYIKRIIAVERGESDDGTIHVHKFDEELEKIRDLGDLTLTVDAVYFNGTSDSGAAVVCNVARRQKGFCDSFFILKLDDSELLVVPSWPDTFLTQKDDELGKYKVAGLTIRNIVPMRTWQIEYDGEMKSKNIPDKRVQVKASFIWSTAFPPFDYKRISPVSMAKDMAREPWSKAYFKMLKKHHQEHYEQSGVLQGTAVVDGKEHRVNMPCLRDHSFSSHRDWRNFHRYVYHFIYLENGDTMAVGCACQPLILSHLSIGYYNRAKDQRVFQVDSSDFKLYEHGENQILPKDYAFTFTSHKKSFTVQVQMKEEEIFYIGKNREAKFYERWCHYEVNNIKGWGCSEWYYNNQVPRN